MAGNIDTKLKAIFDYQKFEHNEQLADLIDETMKKIEKPIELDDDELSFVAAAGNVNDNHKYKEHDKTK